ncbi:hypothetical protein G4Y79_20940 [Phototrophicus methaneseepsis]|uniref:Uncharacterized protein n=1 Tax=Phototrophicus methaneseepsis TaxID=2710758 RepID=A0A7S8IE72_9CHLR|nr:hypothetical protein [Phototrophicus methaneseepsis]QPC82124.1 hypothetical protein G4Y79_20940 [Phototrophicus methaneseepsis]
MHKINRIGLFVLLVLMLLAVMPVMAQESGGDEAVIVISQSAAVVFFIGVVIVLGATFAGMIYFARMAGIAISPGVVGIFAEQIKDLAKTSIENAKSDAAETSQPWDDLLAGFGDAIIKALTPLFDEVVGLQAETARLVAAQGVRYVGELDTTNTGAEINGDTKRFTVEELTGQSVGEPSFSEPIFGAQGVVEDTKVHPPLADEDSHWYSKARDEFENTPKG